MILIAGTRAYFRTESVSSHGFCVHCGRFVRRRSYFARNFFHLYYLPLIPQGPRQRFHQVCPKCHSSVTIEVDAFKNAVAGLKGRCAEALMSLIEGQREVQFTDAAEEEPPIDSVRFLVEVSDWLHDAGEGEFLESMIDKLRASGQSSVADRIDAEQLRLRGRRREAIEAMQSIIARDPSDTSTPQRLAPILTVARQHSDAADAWGVAADGLPPGESLLPRANQFDSLVAAGRHDEAVDVGEQLLQLQPRIVGDDRQFAKAFAKAKKKAGRV